MGDPSKALRREARPQTTRRGFDYAGHVVEVECLDKAHLDWLDEFLAPAFAPCEATRRDFCVSLEVDPDRFESLLAQGPQGGPSIAFAGDQRDILLPQWNAGKGAKALYDQQFGVFYFPDTQGVNLLAGLDTPRLRTPLMRAVREYAMNHLATDDSLVLHAAAFCFEGRAAILAGPKYAGKTSLLIHALHGEGVAYLANDRLSVSIQGGQVGIRGMPTIVSIRETTFDLFPELRRRMLECRFHHRATLAEPRSPTVWKPGAAAISPAQLCELLDRPSIAAARPGAVVLPRIVSEAGATQLRPVPASEAAQRLYPNVFASVHPLPGSALVPEPVASAARSPTAVRSLCEALCREVPCFDLALAPDAYPQLEVPHLLRGLFASGADPGA